MTNLGCGTAGCALGELPGAWPDEFSFDPQSGRIIDLTQPPHMRDTDRWGTRGTYVLACQWFWLQTWMFNLLFLPGAECVSYYGGMDPIERSVVASGVRRLDRDATAEEVANNILKFCEFWKSEEQPEKDILC